MNPPNLSKPETVVLQHPTLKLELVLPRGSLADLLLRLGYIEVGAAIPDPTTTLSTTESEIDND